MAILTPSGPRFPLPMIVRKEKENYILDAHNDRRPKNKRHATIDIRFQQGDGIDRRESIPLSCREGLSRLSRCRQKLHRGAPRSSIRVVIGFKVGGGETEFIGKWGVQSQPHYRALQKTTKRSLSRTADFLIPSSYRNCRARFELLVLFCLLSVEMMR